MRIADLFGNIDVLETRGDLSGSVSSICYDSRKCSTDGLFVAIPGLKTDGHDYVIQAADMGARCIVHEKDIPSLPGITTIRVKNARAALGTLGKNFFGDPSARLCLVSVMGTNGKTTITYLLESIFKAAGLRAGVLGTVNYRYGDVVLPAPNTTPESFEMQRILAEMVRAGVTHVLAEVSSHAVDLRRVDDCEFDLGIFTNLSQDHLDYHGTMERYFQAKSRFFTEILPRSKKHQAIRMVVNRDDPWGQRLLGEVTLPAWGFGMAPAGDVGTEAYECRLEGIRADVYAGNCRMVIESPLIGKFNLYNILAAAGASISLGIDPGAVIRGIAALKCVPGRLERVNATGQPHVFVDYAHTDDALQKVLENLAPFRRNRIITVFGCGGDRDRGKRPLMAQAAVGGSDWTVLTSDNPRSEDPLEILRQIEAGVPVGIPRYTPETLPGAAKGYTVIADRKSAIETAISMATETDIVLIAGKGHEDYQILGEKRIFFDDRVVAREALGRLFPERGEL